jgi:hypothetical protein
MDEYIDTDIGIYHVMFKCDYKDTDGHALYHVKCRFCGYESDMRLYDIKHPTICKHVNKRGNIINFSVSWENQSLKYVFQQMQDRCFNPNNKSYKWYGAKGITICDEWLDDPQLFKEWALNNGYKDCLTIDRIDSDKNYCPENCQWIPLAENSRKAGSVNWITVGEETLTGRQWANKLGIGENTINKIIKKYGPSNTIELISKMLDDPPSTKHRKSKQTWFSVYGIDIEGENYED